MRLSDCVQNLLVEQDKLTEYLLSPTHPAGRSKADFLSRFGYSIEHWLVLQQALIEHATACEVAAIEQAPFGTRYKIVGSINSPDGRHPHITSIWQVKQGSETARLITLMPRRGDWT